MTWDQIIDAYVPGSTPDALVRLGSAVHGGAYSNQVLPSTCDWVYTLEVSYSDETAIAVSTSNSLGDPNNADYAMMLIGNQVLIKHPGISAYQIATYLTFPRTGYTHLKLTKDGSNIKF